MTLDAARFAQGLSIAAYMAQMQENQEPFAANYAGAIIPPEVCAWARDRGVAVQVLVLTEDWCGDSLRYLPVLARLAACAGNWTMRVFPRDANLDLADQYLYEGTRRAIPVFVFFDPQMRELGRFIERPVRANQERQALIDRLAATQPVVTAGQPANAQSEAAREILIPALAELGHARQAAWQAAMIAEIRAALDPAEIPGITSHAK